MNPQPLFAEELEPIHVTTTTTTSFLRAELDTKVIRRTFLSRDTIFPRSNSKWLNILEGDTIFNKAVFDLLEEHRLTSSCPEQKVAAAIYGVANGTAVLLSLGVNGSSLDHAHPPLYIHKRTCLHAEDRALRSLPSISQYYHLVCYASLAPCLACAEELYDYGVEALAYVYEYRERAGKEYLSNRGRPVYNLRATGKTVPLNPDLRWQPFASAKLTARRCM